MDYREIDRLVDESFSCDCSDTVLTLFVDAAGRNHIRKQCRRCGSWSAVRKGQFQALPKREFNANRQGEWNRQKMEYRMELQEQFRNEESREWWRKYNDYLRSEKWKEKRAKRLEHDGYVCQACLIRRAEQVHHLTYERVGAEPLFDLVSVCIRCHDALTKLSRGEITTPLQRPRIN